MKGKEFLKKLFSIAAATSAFIGSTPTLKAQTPESSNTNTSLSSQEAKGSVAKLVFSRSSSGVVSSSWHESHYSHQSHSSHSSHYSHYSSYQFEPITKE